MVFVMVDTLVWEKVMLDSYSKLLGVPYRKNGRDLNGLDCLGLVLLINKERNINMPDYVTPDDNMIYQLVMEGKELVEKLDNPESGCIVLFNVRNYLFHIGIVLEDCASFIHIIQKRNVCKEKLNHDFWKHRIEGFYRWKV